MTTVQTRRLQRTSSSAGALPRQTARGRFLRRVAAGAVAVVVGATVIPIDASALAPGPCTSPKPGAPIFVTPDCVDPTYNRPVIDSETNLTSPISHRVVAGHFEGTDKRFKIYLPSTEQFEGRFFHSVYPLTDENASGEVIAFGADSGAYTVQTNGGGGYRVDAAAAKFAETVAADYYDWSDPIYGYIYGGSGGSFQTIGAMENTSGVWDGAVPFIPGVPTSIPNNFFVRAFARFVLEDDAQQIADAVSPGGSGDPYAGLDATERDVLLEVTKMGVPLRAWEDYAYVLGLNDSAGLLGFGSVAQIFVGGYANSFWSEPGYLGTEQSALGEMFREARIRVATITQVNRNASNVITSVVLDDVAPVSSPAGLAAFTVLAADGSDVGTIPGALDATTKTLTIGSGATAEVLDALAVGAQVEIDNTWPLALLSLHRHQVPSRPGYYAFDQFRDAAGQPLYPQQFEIGPLIAGSVTGGGTYTGNITGKMIIVSNLLDADAFPWHADWYSARVQEALGDRYDDMFRVWYNDNADHIGARTPRLVDYNGILQQALRDVSAWAEQGVAPPASTRYHVDQDSQVHVAATAAQRRGIQPVVDLTVQGRGSDRVEVAVGQTVTFQAKIQVPPNTGKVVATDWDFTGSGNFVAASLGSPKPTVHVRATFTYTEPGTYYVALRATSQRDGDPSTPFARINNLDRIRVVVR